MIIGTAGDLLDYLLELRRKGVVLDEVAIAIHDHHDDEYYYSPSAHDEKMDIPGAPVPEENHVLIFEMDSY